MDAKEDVCENSSRLIVELTELTRAAEVGALSEQENGEQMLKFVAGS